MRECVDVLYSLCYGLLLHTHWDQHTSLSLSLLPLSTDWKDNGYVRWTSVHGCTYHVHIHGVWHVLKNAEDSRQTTLAQYDLRITHSGFNMIGQSLT